MCSHSSTIFDLWLLRLFFLSSTRMFSYSKRIRNRERSFQAVIVNCWFWWKISRVETEKISERNQFQAFLHFSHSNLQWGDDVDEIRGSREILQKSINLPSSRNLKITHAIKIVQKFSSANISNFSSCAALQHFHQLPMDAIVQLRLWVTRKSQEFVFTEFRHDFGG